MCEEREEKQAGGKERRGRKGEERGTGNHRYVQDGGWVARREGKRDREGERELARKREQNIIVKVKRAEDGLETHRTRSLKFLS